MKATFTRNEALELLKKYNKEPFHIQHALTVEGVMRYFAETLGYAAEADDWALVGLLHDVDFELYPEEHCLKAPEMLKEIGFRNVFYYEGRKAVVCTLA
jgi:predicted hydrolase (HD superfamily)